jgi:hypothetical protein
LSKFVDDLPPSILRDWMNLACDKKLGGGSGRTVFVYGLDPKLVIKVESSGFQNVMEWETWRAVKSTQYAKLFAPCRHIAGLGTVLIMDRTLPAPRRAYAKSVPACLGDLKYSNFGLLRGKLVCHDYGTLTNLLAGTLSAKMRMRKADWWDAGDGSSFDDSKAA